MELGDPVAARRVAVPSPLTITCQTKYATLLGPDPHQRHPGLGTLPPPASPLESCRPASCLSLPSAAPHCPRTLRSGAARPLPVWACPQQGGAVKGLTRGPACRSRLCFFSLTFTDRKPGAHLPLAGVVPPAGRASLRSWKSWLGDLNSPG